MPLKAEVQLRRSGQSNYLVNVHDISPEGCRLEFVERPRLDETVWLVPGHCDPTVNLHDVMIGVTGGLSNGKVDKIIRVDARGALT